VCLCPSKCSETSACCAFPFPAATRCCEPSQQPALRVRSFVEEDGENRKRRKEALAVPAPPPKHHQGTAMRVVDDDDASGGEEAHAMSVKHGACERQARAGPRLCGPARRATTRGNGLQRLSAGARGRARGPTWKTVCSPASTCFPRLHRGSALTSLPCSTVLPPPSY